MRWFFALFLFLAACSTTPPPVNRLRISFNTEPTTLDPRQTGDFVSSTLICMLYEGLTRCLPNGSIEPALAERVEISPDQKTYTFHLRKAFWSNGKRITAFDFEASWKNTLHPSSLCAYLFYPIQNAEKYVKGEVPLEAVGIRSLNARTLQVQLEQPTPYFYSLTAFPSFLAASKEPDVWSGPFSLKTRKTQSEILLVKNPTFWNARAISLDEIHISIVPDEMTAFHMFEQGELDWIGGSFSPLPLDAIEKLKDQLILIPTPASTFCTFNTQSFPFSNLHLRKAFSYAINRDKIAEPSGQIAATSILPPLFTSQSRSFFDPDKARYHLAEALKEIPLESLQNLTLYYKPSQAEKRLAQTLQQQWEETLSLSVQIVGLDYKSHAHRLQKRDYQLSLATWIAQFSDPISILERFKDKANLKNYPGWEHPSYTAVLNDPTNRPLSLQQAEALLADQLPLAPIYHWTTPALQGPRIPTTPTSPCGGILFERFQLKQEPSPKQGGQKQNFTTRSQGSLESTEHTEEKTGKG